MNKPIVYSIDFDGTLAVTDYPTIIKPITMVIDFCKQLKQNGDLLILNTCRTGEHLESAVKWCADQGLTFDAVNENLLSRIIEFGGDCRKISADYYIDDRNIHPERLYYTDQIDEINICWWRAIKK